MVTWTQIEDNVYTAKLKGRDAHIIAPYTHNVNRWHWTCGQYTSHEFSTQQLAQQDAERNIPLHLDLDTTTNIFKSLIIILLSLDGIFHITLILLPVLLLNAPIHADSALPQFMIFAILSPFLAALISYLLAWYPYALCKPEFIDLYLTRHAAKDLNSRSNSPSTNPLSERDEQ